MRSGLNTLKNIIWAIACAVGLGAVFVGLIIMCFKPYNGQRQDGTLMLGTGVKPMGGLDIGIITGQDTPTIDVNVGLSASAALLGETADAGMEYIDELTFICDSHFAGMKNYGLLTDGITTKQVWLGSGGTFPATSIAGTTIIYPGDGSELLPATAAMVSKPKVIVMMLGNDSASETSQDVFLSDYKSLISNIKLQSPDTKLICASTCASGAANLWIQQICEDCGCYYADLTSVLLDSGGRKVSAFFDGEAVSAAGINAVLEYLRTHALSLTVPMG